MAQKYVKPRMWKETQINFKRKMDQINTDLRNMGIKKKVKMTKFLHAVSLHPFYPDEAGISIKNLTSKRRR